MKHLVVNTTAYTRYLEGFARQVERLGYAARTKTSLSSCAREFLYHLEQSCITGITTLKPSHIQAHYTYLQERPNNRQGGALSSSHITFHMYAIRLFLEYLQQENTLQSDPMGGLVFERGGYKERETLTREEIGILYESCQNLRDTALLSLLYGCGLRSAEARNLDVADVHFRASVLYVRHGKGDKRREVPMGEKVTEYLKAYYYNERHTYTNPAYGENAFILTDRGGRASGGCMRRRLKSMVAKAGIEKQVTLHTLRHTVATHLLANGMGVEYVRIFLGHNSLETTQLYTHIVQQQLKNLEHEK